MLLAVRLTNIVHEHLCMCEKIHDLNFYLQLLPSAPDRGSCLLAACEEN